MKLPINQIMWNNCYDDSWKDQIVSEAFSHPAKMAYGLVNRIFTHAQEQGWLAPESIIVDPFGGISTTGIIAAYRGYQCLTVELEPKFTNLAMQNVKLHKAKWDALKCPYPVIIQGDSRRLSEIIGRTDLIVSSPPYSEAITTRKGPSGLMGGTFRLGRGDMQANKEGYGHTPGQLGSMKAGDVDCVISSPPYAETEIAAGNAKQADIKDRKIRRADKNWQGYGSTKGNLGNLKAGDISMIVSSPPYEDAQNVKSDNPKYLQKFNVFRDAKYGKGHSSNKFDQAETQVGSTDGQLGQERGDTFWSAAKTIVEQCFEILKPGGVAIWVCKDFVRKGQRVPFSDDWLKLCEAVGFKLTCRHRAMLVKEETKDDLFGGTITKKTERKSFFRRLAEAKGSPAIDHEDVICVMKTSVKI